MYDPNKGKLTDDRKLLLFLLHIQMLSANAGNLFEALSRYSRSNFHEIDVEAHDLIWNSILELITIKYLGFSKEFNEYKSLIPNKELQKECKKKLKGINKKWPDIEKYRNEILAHNFRLGKGESIFNQPLETSYTIPRDTDDHWDLVEAMTDINLVLRKEYSQQYKIIEDKDLLKEELTNKG
jgi:hypothetical protein